jgi:hypothetical protein
MNYFLVLILALTVREFNVGPENRSEKNNEISAVQLKEWVSFLASDQMRGRRNGSPEMKTAATWIEEKFKAEGLIPLLPDGNFIQNYTYTSRQAEVSERNVIAYIEGSDKTLKKEYIVLSSHFDHIGIKRGSMADSICNGADDNAAGTVTLIAIAKAIKESGIKPSRSIIFAAFSGEENGMRGSRYFVANSPVPLKHIFADINFEMIGHSEFLGKNKFYMTGCLNSNLDDVIGEYNKTTEFQLIDTIRIAHMLFNASDNIAFSRISTTDGIITGIPSGTFATTTEANYLHQPSDEAGLFDFENMAGLVNHFSGMVLWLSKNKSEIVWTDPKFKRP